LQIRRDIGNTGAQRTYRAAVYGSAGNKRALVEEWLRRKAQDREDALKREEIDIARDAAVTTRREEDSRERENRHPFG